MLLFKCANVSSFSELLFCTKEGQKKAVWDTPLSMQ